MKNQWQVTRNQSHTEMETITYSKGDIQLSYLVFRDEICSITLISHKHKSMYEVPRDTQTGLDLINQITTSINLRNDLIQEMLNYLPKNSITSIFHKPSKKSKRPEKSTMEEPLAIATCAYLTSRL